MADWLRGGRKSAFSVIEAGLPIRVTRVAPLMGDKFALEIFRRDGLEAHRADRIDRFVRISSMGEWTQSIH
jgi:hypothetical protein